MTDRGDSFDRLSRSLGEAKSRRQVIRLLGGGVVAALGAALVSRSTRAGASGSSPDPVGTLPPHPHTGPCPHSVCEVQSADGLLGAYGSDMPLYCDAGEQEACHHSICQWDDYCCNPVLGRWDANCVGYVKSQCTFRCPTSTRTSTRTSAPSRRAARPNAQAVKRSPTL